MGSAFARLQRMWCEEFKRLLWLPGRSQQPPFIAIARSCRSADAARALQGEQVLLGREAAGISDEMAV